MSVNKVILVGHVGNDPEIKHLDKDVSVAKFSLATSEYSTSPTGEKTSTTEWHKIIAWRTTAEVVEKYVKKGSQIYLEGKIRSRSYDINGIKHYITEIFANRIEILGKREGQAEMPGQAVPKEQLQTVGEPDLNRPEEDDLPF